MNRALSLSGNADARIIFSLAKIFDQLALLSPENQQMYYGLAAERYQVRYIF